MWGQLIAAGIVLAVIGFLVLMLARAARRGGEMEADLDHQRRQTEAIVADQERADDIEQRADAARRALAEDSKKLAGDGDALAKRLRDSGRGRAPRK